jgi:hypothetical protein
MLCLHAAGKVHRIDPIIHQHLRRQSLERLRCLRRQSRRSLPRHRQKNLQAPLPPHRQKNLQAPLPRHRQKNLQELIGQRLVNLLHHRRQSRRR